MQAGTFTGKQKGEFVETVFMFLAIAFAVIMLILLPKYAKFIHQQPKERLEQIRRQEEAQKQSLENENPKE